MQTIVVPGLLEQPKGRRRAVFQALLLSGAVFSVLLFTTPWSTLWDRDEPRFAQASLEMVDSGRYLFPTFRGEVRAHKPILTYWLMSVSLRVLGPTELAARFWSPVAVAAVCLFVFQIGKALISPRAGLWAIVALGATPLLVVEGTLATADAILLAGTTGALAVFASTLRDRMTPGRCAALGLALGFALLAKGPPGLLVPLLAMGTALLLLPRESRYARRDAAGIAVAVVLGLLLFGAWFLPANSATGGAFLREGFLRQVLQRAVEPMEGHGGGGILYLPYYVPVILVGFAPWTLYLPAAVSALAGGRIGGKKVRAFLIGWAAPWCLVVTLVATKLPHYILPIWPALALAVGGTLEAEQEGRLSERDRRWLRRGIWFFAPVLALAVLLLLGGVWFLPAPALRLRVALFGCAVAALGAASLREHAAGRFRRGAVVLCAGFAGLQLLGAPLLLPALEPFKPAPAIARAVRARVPEPVPVSTFDFDEPSLDFYLHPSRVRWLPDPAALEQWPREPGAGILIASRGALAPLLLGRDEAGLTELGSARGFNYSKGRWVDLVALGKNLDAARGSK